MSNVGWQLRGHEENLDFGLELSQKCQLLKAFGRSNSPIQGVKKQFFLTLKGEKMQHKISILFFSRIRGKSNGNLLPLYMRITINGERIEQTIQRHVDPTQWSASAGKMTGKSPEARIINNHLNLLTSKVHDIEKQLLQAGKVVTYQSFKDKWFGIEEKPFMLLEVFQQHNDQVKELVGREYSKETLQRYITSRDHTRSFLKWKYQVDDIDIRKLNYEFISDYAFWLKSKRNCNHNSTMKYLANFKKIVLLCIKKGWLQKDPFTGFKLTRREVQKPFLTEGELKEIASKQFPIARLTYVRDIFLFSCFTGLAYADVKKLKRSEIGVGLDGEKWIMTKRQKTNTPSRIPLLPGSLQILNTYQDHPQCVKDGKVLPVLSNQKMNAYLKEIADACGIEKNLTFHIARHTFATTVTLCNGVPIETVSKMLGHTNLKTTQHYAKILDLKVSEDMKALRDKLSNKS